VKKLVCLSGSPWLASPNRTQQLITRLKDVEILFFEPYSAGKSRSEERRMRANITVCTLPARIPEDPNGSLSQRRAMSRVNRFLEKTLQKHRFRDFILWTDSPEYHALVGQLPHSGLLYDCFREWDDLPLEWESDLALQTDVAFAASPGLAERLAPCCENVAVIPNGVNYPMFSRDDWEVPRILRGRDRPILCRIGAVTGELELEPLIHAATVRPEWTFVMVGEVDDSALAQLGRYHNIVLPGKVPMVDVPDYLGSCQVSFDLLSGHTRGSDLLPIRFYEYMAVGNPVVLMLEEDQVEPFPDVVYTAATPSEFLRRCEKAVAEDPGWVRSRRRAYAEEAQWSDRAGEIQRILEDSMLI